MDVFCVWEIIEDEHCGTTLYEIFKNEEDAKKCVEENQETFTHWTGKIIKRFSYTIEEVIF